MIESALHEYLRRHLARVRDVLRVLEELARSQSSLELHRFFARLQMEMRDDPRLLHELIFGLGLADGEDGPSIEEPVPVQESIASSWDLLMAAEWLELEMQGKMLMWRALLLVRGGIPAWRGMDFEGHQAQAKSQRDRLEKLRLELVHQALQ